jgi:hydroxymethylglutaryl-CoA lyase
MADGAAVMAGIERRPGTRYAALVPNMKGYEAALAAQVDEMVIFAAASEAFSQKNINCSIAESIERFRPVAEATLAAGKRLRAAVSCAFGCPYQGEVPLAAVIDVVDRLHALGCHEIDVADTIGVGTPGQVKTVFKALQASVPAATLAGHFHDTYGMAVANIVAALDCDIRLFHSSVAGLGGCPYARGATGNVASEDVLFLMQGLGLRTGIDLDAVVEIGQWISGHLGRRAASRAGNALWARRTHAQEG